MMMKEGSVTKDLGERQAQAPSLTPASSQLVKNTFPEAAPHHQLELCGYTTTEFQESQQLLGAEDPHKSCLQYQRFPSIQSPVSCTLPGS
jgi:hypothetical protein